MIEGTELSDSSRHSMARAALPAALVRVISTMRQSGGRLAVMHQSGLAPEVITYITAVCGREKGSCAGTVGVSRHLVFWL
jgi:hypothetical protein